MAVFTVRRCVMSPPLLICKVGYQYLNLLASVSHLQTGVVVRIK